MRLCGLPGCCKPACHPVYPRQWPHASSLSSPCIGSPGELLLAPNLAELSLYAWSFAIVVDEFYEYQLNGSLQEHLAGFWNLTLTLTRTPTLTRTLTLTLTLTTYA